MQITSLPLRRAAVQIALRMYGRMPDVEDRVADALAALVEANATFRPKPGKDGDGYRVRYALGQVTGKLRNWAQKVKDASDTEVTAADLGVAELRFDGPSELFGDNVRLWVQDGNIVTEDSILAKHPEAEEALKHLVTDIEDDVEPVYIFEPQETPLFLSDIDNAEAVLAASRHNPQWDFEDLSVFYDNRPDDHEGPATMVTRDKYTWHRDILTAWGEARAAWAFLDDAAVDGVTGALRGEDGWPQGPDVDLAIRAMENLSDIIIDHTDDESFDLVARSVARTLADKIVADGLRTEIKGELLQDSLRVMFVDYFGAEPDAYEAMPLPSIESLDEHVQAWLAKLQCWPSQRAGIKCLLNGGTPYDARQIERAYFSDH